MINIAKPRLRDLVACVLAVAPMLSGPARADPMADICAARARSESGEQAPIEGRSANGKMTFGLSGSVALGASSNRGAASPGGNAPAFAGSAASDRFEQDRRQKAGDRYQKIYNRCMAGR